MPKSNMDISFSQGQEHLIFCYWIGNVWHSKLIFSQKQIMTLRYNQYRTRKPQTVNPVSTRIFHKGWGSEKGTAAPWNLLHCLSHLLSFLCPLLFTPDLQTDFTSLKTLPFVYLCCTQLSHSSIHFTSFLLWDNYRFTQLSEMMQRSFIYSLLGFPGVTFCKTTAQ